MLRCIFIILSTFRTLFAQDFNISETGDAYFVPDIAADSAGNFIVVWGDGRNSSENEGPDSGTAIYAQKYTTDGTPIGDNLRVSELRPGVRGDARIPSIGMRKSGDFVVAWHASGDHGIWGDTDIYARRYDSTAKPLGQSFKVNDDMGTNAQLDAKVMLRGDGSFIITWADRRDGPLYAYAQIYDSAGLPQGKNFKVTMNGVEDIANIGLFEDGRFFFMWSKYLQFYGPDGTADGGIIDIGIDGSGTVIGKDSILVLWYSFPQYKILARFFNAEGQGISDSFRIDNGNVLNNPVGGFSVAISKRGEFIVVWQDHRNDLPGVVGDGDIYAQRYDKRGVPVGANFKLNHESEERWQRNPATVFNTTASFATVWLDDQTPLRCPPLPPDVIDLSSGIVNIVGTIQLFDNPIPGEVYGWTTLPRCPPPPPPANYTLQQNYPNPFDLSTAISYTLSIQSNVVLEIYNAWGQKVTMLSSKAQPAGKYTIPWNGRDAAGKIVSSGIYFCRLQAEGGEVHP